MRLRPKNRVERQVVMPPLVGIYQERLARASDEIERLEADLDELRNAAGRVFETASMAASPKFESAVIEMGILLSASGWERTA